MFRTRLLALGLAAATAVLAACGTGVHEHSLEISVSDPSSRLGAGPWELSVFDGRMGRSEEWARKTMGTASASAPWRTAFSTVDTVTLGMARPAKVDLWLYLPALERRGFFQVRLEPQARPSGHADAAFGSFGEAVPPADVPKLDVRYTATAAEKGWSFALTLEVPEGPPAAAAASQGAR
jgi:hypothetical protein